MTLVQGANPTPCVLPGTDSAGCRLASALVVPPSVIMKMLVTYWRLTDWQFTLSSDIVCAKGAIENPIKFGRSGSKWRKGNQVAAVSEKANELFIVVNVSENGTVLFLFRKCLNILQEPRPDTSASPFGLDRYARQSRKFTIRQVRETLRLNRVNFRVTVYENRSDDLVPNYRDPQYIPTIRVGGAVPWWNRDWLNVLADFIVKQVDCCNLLPLIIWRSDGEPKGVRVRKHESVPYSRAAQAVTWSAGGARGAVNTRALCPEGKGSQWHFGGDYSRPCEIVADITGRRCGRVHRFAPPTGPQFAEPETRAHSSSSFKPSTENVVVESGCAKPPVVGRGLHKILEPNDLAVVGSHFQIPLFTHPVINSRTRRLCCLI